MLKRENRTTRIGWVYHKKSFSFFINKGLKFFKIDFPVIIFSESVESRFDTDILGDGY